MHSNFWDEANSAPKWHVNAQAADNVGRGAMKVLAPPFSHVGL
jgi:hypothetical protein